MNYLTLFISLRCTQACAHCLYGCSPEKGEHMSWDVFIKSIEIAKASNIPTLNFFGGEPMLNPHILTMLQTAFENSFDLMLATNCRPLIKDNFFSKFLNITKQYRDRMVIFTARDKFHLHHFDPIEVVEKLQSENYEVVISDYSNDSILLSEYNIHNSELRELNTHYSCCGGSWTDYLGVLPDGRWTICPPSLESFGDIFSQSLQEIVAFKRGLPLRYKEGCSECLKDFKVFRKEFEKQVTTQKK
jgi:MoaA/NifB/PqqE/SkfB family radical SAM enzyme